VDRLAKQASKRLKIAYPELGPLGSARKLLSRISGRVGIFPFRSGSSSI